MLRQYAARSGAPGNTAAIPTIATARSLAVASGIEDRARVDAGAWRVRVARRRQGGGGARPEPLRIAGHQDHLGGAAAVVELGEQRRDPGVGLDQADAAPRVLAL